MYKVLNKRLSMDMILDDGELADRWAQDKCVRECAYLNMVCVLEQINELTDSQVSDWRLPDNCVLRPIKPGEARMLQGGEWVLFDTTTRDAVVEFPIDMLNFRFGFQTHVPDHSSIGASFLHFCIHQRMLFTPYWDWCHGVWNCLRNAAKKVGPFASKPKGYVWRAILEMLIVVNMNAGPYRSGQWFEAKRHGALRWCQLYTVDSPEFESIVHHLGKANHIDTSTLPGRLQCYDMMSRLKSCCEKGPHLKLMRWMSIPEIWKYHRRQIWGVKGVLKLLSDEAQDGHSDIIVQAGTTTGALDGNVLKAMESKTGTVCKAHTYITEDNVHCLDVFCTVTKPLQKRVSSREHFVKSVEEGVKDDYEYFTRVWCQELVDTLHATMKDRDNLESMQLTDAGHPDHRQRCREAFEFCMVVCKTRYDDQLYNITCYPPKFILVSGAPSENTADVARRTTLKVDWDITLEAEKAALTNQIVRDLVADIFWMRWPVVRLLMTQNEMEVRLRQEGGFLRSCKSVTRRWPDEHGSENVHQHERDHTRTRRFTHIGPTRIYRTQIEADVPRSLNMSAPRCSDEEVAREAIRQKRIPSTKWWVPNEKRLPAEFKDILMADKTFSSPKGISYTKAGDAWLWLRNYYLGFRRQRVPIVRAWHSRLCPENMLLIRKRDHLVRLVISSLQWHICAAACTPHATLPHTYVVDFNPEAVFAMHVVDENEWSMHFIDIHFVDGDGLVITTVGIGEIAEFSLVQAALLRGVPLANNHMEALAGSAGYPLPDQRTELNLREALICGSFADLPALQQLARDAFETTKKDAAPDALVPVGLQFGELLDEILSHDAINESEIRSLRHAVKAHTVRRLLNIRSGLRHQKASNKRLRAQIAVAKARAKAAAAKAHPGPGGPGAPGVPPVARGGGRGGGRGAGRGAGLPPLEGLPDDLPLAALGRGRARGKGGRGRGGNRGGGKGGCGGGDSEDEDGPRKEWRAVSWGHWHIAEIYKDGVHVAWGATCRNHNNPGENPTRTYCKTYLGITRTRSSDLARLQVKQWLICGMHLEPGPMPRTEHVFTPLANIDLTEAECDEIAERLQAPT